VPTAVHFCIVP